MYLIVCVCLLSFRSYISCCFADVILGAPRTSHTKNQSISHKKIYHRSFQLCLHGGWKKSIAMITRHTIPWMERKMMSFVVESLNNFLSFSVVILNFMENKLLRRWALWMISDFECNVSGGDKIKLIHRSINFPWQISLQSKLKHSKSPIRSNLNFSFRLNFNLVSLCPWLDFLSEKSFVIKQRQFQLIREFCLSSSRRSKYK